MSDLELYRPDPSNPHAVASSQAIDADAHIDRHPGTLMRWPWAALDELTGPMGGGEVWFTAAFSGGGKTSFVVSAVDAWRRQGKRVYVLPLETQPFRFRTYLACMETGTHPGDALSGKLRADPMRDFERKQLKAALLAQGHDDWVKTLRVAEQRWITIKALRDECKAAADFGADIVVIDHIDHISAGDGTNLPTESRRVNDALLQLAQDYKLLIWPTSQLNMEIVRGSRDYLAKYAPPMPHHLQYPTAKIKNATGIIGLFRPLRPLRPSESGKEFEDFMRLARANALPDITAALETNTMGVNAMKLRNYGQHEGRKIKLGFERGRVVDLRPVDRYEDPR